MTDNDELLRRVERQQLRTRMDEYKEFLHYAEVHHETMFYAGLVNRYIEMKDLPEEHKAVVPEGAQAAADLFIDMFREDGDDEDLLAERFWYLAEESHGVLDMFAESDTQENVEKFDDLMQRMYRLNREIREHE